MKNDLNIVEIKLQNNQGCLSIDSSGIDSSIWTRIKLSLRNKNVEHTINGTEIRFAWQDLLEIVRELGTRSNQTALNFRFRPIGDAVKQLKRFSKELAQARKQRGELKKVLSSEEIQNKLNSVGFSSSKRTLRKFQLRDLSHLLSLSNGANFSVPGAGKTTVTFALHMLTRQPGQHLIIVAPKAAFQAWTDIVDECIEEDAPNNAYEPFSLLTGNEVEIRNSLNSGSTRFIISYDLMIRQQNLIANHIATTPTHLVLDESHRMKAGWLSQRGAFLLNISSLPIRRDILTGTPMPQGASDIESQLNFLWPGHGLGHEVVLGKSPREVLGSLYVRTTKKELGLPDVTRKFIDVSMSPGQLALYSIVRNEFLRNFSKKVNKGLGDSQFSKARRSVMRLLQLSVNPVLALTAMGGDDAQIESSIVDQVMKEGHSAKMQEVMKHARDLAAKGEKTVIWTIFTDTIHSFVSSLADLNPVCIHGGVPSGSSSDPETREGQIKRFHEDDSCFVLVANPAAAGEGISLHKVCHNAIYADRGYVSTHWIQSIDRIHRLGLDPDQETNIFVYRSKAPAQIGSIDMSVSRRLTEKIRNMQMLLNDPDLHQLALDEENANDPIDYDIELQDIIDLISELEGSAGDYSQEGS